VKDSRLIPQFINSGKREPASQIMQAKLKEYFAVIVLFLVATLFLTLPLALHLSDYLAGDGGDAYVIIWQFWWFNKAIVDLGQNPYYTNYLLAPQGATLLFHDPTPLYALLSIPLQHIVNLFATYNILLILSLTLTGFGMFLLLLYLTQNKTAAFWGGFIFTFSPWHMGHAVGHFHIVAAEWLPLYVLFFLKAQEKGELRTGLLASGFLALAALNSLYYLQYGVILSGLFCLFLWLTKGQWRSAFKNTFKIFLGTMIFLSPMLTPMILRLAREEFYGAHAPENYSADLLSFFVPGKIQTIGNLFSGVNARLTGGWAEESNYLGYVVLGLAGLAMNRLWRKNNLVRFFAYSGAVFFILSLGNKLKVGGTVTEIPLPYTFAHKFLPGFALSGMPVRMQAMTVFCLAVLAALGIKEILQFKRRTARLLLTAAGVILILEFLCLPFMMSTAYGNYVRSFIPPLGRPEKEVPKIYYEIAKSSEDFCLFDVANGPFYSRRIQEVSYLQTIHQKKLVGGFLARTNKNSIDDLLKTPVLSEILRAEVPKATQGLPCEWRRELARKTLREHNIRYVIVPKESGGYPQNVVPEFYGLCHVFEDAKIFAYQFCDRSTCSPEEE
jgi:hypothetical protein